MILYLQLMNMSSSVPDELRIDYEAIMATELTTSNNLNALTSTQIQS